jgi:uncharacterized protein YfaS (alpha-2-macroglobulin family)
VRATLSLLESGGRPVVRSIERVYWPAPVLVGLRPMFVGAYAREARRPISKSCAPLPTRP